MDGSKIFFAPHENESVACTEDGIGTWADGDLARSFLNAQHHGGRGGAEDFADRAANKAPVLRYFDFREDSRFILLIGRID
jgi:hypothetical protein